MSENSKKTGKRRGFSLIVVLILSIAALAIIGGVLQFAMGSGGLGRVASSSVGRYNMLQDSAELGRAELKRMMNNTNPPPRFENVDNETFRISAADDLLINVNPSGLGKGIISRSNMSASALGRRGILGTSGVLEVRIYDMQYEGGIVNPSISDEERMKLPPSLPILTPDLWKQIGDIKDVEEEDDPGGAPPNTGAYLVRAVLTVGSHESILDTAVFQSNNAK
jgi:hypothetical protein